MKVPFTDTNGIRRTVSMGQLIKLGKNFPKLSQKYHQMKDTYAKQQKSIAMNEQKLIELTQQLNLIKEQAMTLMQENKKLSQNNQYYMQMLASKGSAKDLIMPETKQNVSPLKNTNINQTMPIQTADYLNRQQNLQNTQKPDIQATDIQATNVIAEMLNTQQKNKTTLKPTSQTPNNVQVDPELLKKILNPTPNLLKQGYNNLYNKRTERTDYNTRSRRKPSKPTNTKQLNQLNDKARKPRQSQLNDLTKQQQIKKEEPKENHSMTLNSNKISLDKISTLDINNQQAKVKNEEKQNLNQK